MRFSLFIIAAIAAVVTFSSLQYFLGARYRHFGWHHHYYCYPYPNNRYHDNYYENERAGDSLPLIKGNK